MIVTSRAHDYDDYFLRSPIIPTLWGQPGNVFHPCLSLTGWLGLMVDGSCRNLEFGRGVDDNLPTLHESHWGIFNIDQWLVPADGPSSLTPTKSIYCPLYPRPFPTLLFHVRPTVVLVRQTDSCPNKDESSIQKETKLVGDRSKGSLVVSLGFCF